MSDFFKGKTLVVSGGTRGIGKAIVYEFAKAGVNVAFTYNSNAELATEIVVDLQNNYKIKAKAYEFNILEPETYKEFTTSGHRLYFPSLQNSQCPQVYKLSIN